MRRLEVRHELGHQQRVVFARVIGIVTSRRSDAFAIVRLSRSIQSLAVYLNNLLTPHLRARQNSMPNLTQSW